MFLRFKELDPAKTLEELEQRLKDTKVNYRIKTSATFFQLLSSGVIGHTVFVEEKELCFISMSGRFCILYNLKKYEQLVEYVFMRVIPDASDYILYRKDIHIEGEDDDSDD